MKIAITGSHGLIAKHLKSSLPTEKYEIIPISRQMLYGYQKEELAAAMKGCEVVIHLAGATINQRWTEKAKKEIHDSRIFTTRALVASINEMETKPKLFISTSAIGAYNNGAVCDETELEYSRSFLGQLCQQWENEARKVSPEVRLVIARMGVVLAKDGGALPIIKKPFQFYLGGPIGDGSQGFSWIHITDVVKILQFIIHHQFAKGVINFTSPQNTNNFMLTEALGKIMKRPTLFFVPKFALRLLLGERAQLMTEGQNIYPGQLFRLNYQFRFPTLEGALFDLIKK